MNAAPQFPAKTRGFSLLEVLLALAMFAMAFGLLMETIATAGRTVRVAGDVGHVALWAQNRLDQLGIAEPIAVGSKTGSFDEQYRYTQTISNYTPSDSPAIALSSDELLRIDLEVSWGRGDAARTERFSTLRVKTKEGRF